MSRIVHRVALVSMLVSSAAFAQTKPAPSPVQPTTPAPKPSPVDDPWANRTDLYVSPTMHPSTKVDLGKVDRFTLPNGLQVIAVPRHGAPVVDVALVIPVDDSAEPLDRTGIAAFTASMLHKGTQKRSADALAQEVDGAGAQLDASYDGQLGIIAHCIGRSRDMNLCLDTVSDITLHPTFPEAEMGEIRDQLMSAVEGMRDNPGELARVHAANLFYGDNDPRGRVYSKKTFGAIDRSALLGFYDAWFHPNHAVIAIAGDFDSKALHTALLKWLGTWKKRETPKTPELATPKPGPLKIRLIDKPDATQAQIAIEGLGIRHADPDLYAVTLMNYALGGGAFSSRLMKVVRSENAKTYGASSRFESERDWGVFVANTFTRDAETASTIQLVLGEIEKMKKTGPSEAELAAAKANAIGGYGLRFETASATSQQLLVAAIDGMTPEYVSMYPANLEHVTLADAAKAAKNHLIPQALVIVGNAAKLAPLLAAAKLTPQETISYTDPVSASERNEKKAAAAQAKQAAAMAPQADIDAGKKILQAALVAKGADSIAKVNDLQITASGSISMQGQNMHIGFDGFYVPGKLQEREDLAVAGQDISNVFDGQKAFMKQGVNAKDLPADMAAKAKKEIWRNGHFVLLNAAGPGVQVRALPVVVDGKNKYDALNVVTPDGDSIELEIDQKTHQLVKLAYTEDGQQSAWVMSDYKSEGGISFARHIVISEGPQRIELSVDKVKLNKGLAGDTFKR